MRKALQKAADKNEIEKWKRWSEGRVLGGRNGGEKAGEEKEEVKEKKEEEEDEEE